MKQFLLLMIISMTGAAAIAQSGSWVIKINDKTILSASTENEEANTRKIKSADWKKSGHLEINFTESEPDTWYRFFLFYDEEDNELLRKDSTVKAKISLAELCKLYKGKKEIILYTTITPTDPTIAIRMRRVHLCTLKIP